MSDEMYLFFVGIIVHKFKFTKCNVCENFLTIIKIDRVAVLLQNTG